MIISTDPLQLDTEALRGNFIHPEEKTVCVVDKVIMPITIIVHVEDDMRVLIQGNVFCLACFFDELRGTNKKVYFSHGITDIVLCEYMLRNGLQRSCNAHEKETYEFFVVK